MLDIIFEDTEINDSYNFAKDMEKNKTNVKLGFRTAGSDAEIKTGQMIYEKMLAIGLDEVTKDEITVDKWDFKKANMKFNYNNNYYNFELGAYQTNFNTYGEKSFSIVYLSKGTKVDYENIDVENKLVLVDINQKDEWWINFPVYQAYLKKAAALIAVQVDGYSKIDNTALNAQDIAGPDFAPAFSISRKDSDVLKKILKETNEFSVVFDACSEVIKDQKTYNILGKINGSSTDSAILVSAHYDSYFSGFQDDNAAISMMLSIAKKIKCSYKPNRTILFCAMAAEEWGITNTKYDWSTGAYKEVFEVHPNWRTNVIIDFNFELPAHAHDKKDKVRCVYEYNHFIKKSISNFNIGGDVFEEGLEVVSPIQTWSDDFSIAISGIPSTVNDFSDSSFMQTHYHSQFDNDEFYQKDVYKFHHNLYLNLILSFDKTVVAPLNFSKLFSNIKNTIDFELCEKNNIDTTKILELLEKLKTTSKSVYKKIESINNWFRDDIDVDKVSYYKKYNNLEKNLLDLFFYEQNNFVKLNWHDDVHFPHEIVQNNLIKITEAIKSLEKKDIYLALRKIYNIDNNRYAFLFDKEVYEYFTNYVLNQPKSRLMWGYGRIVCHENLYDLINSLKNKYENNNFNLDEQLLYLKQIKLKYEKLYAQIISKETVQLQEFLIDLQKI